MQTGLSVCFALKKAGLQDKKLLNINLARYDCIVKFTLPSA